MVEDPRSYDDTVAATPTPATGPAATRLGHSADPVAPGTEQTIAASGEPRGATPTPHVGRRDDYPELVPVDPMHYVVGDEIAKGGMGRILAARDRRLGRPVAIKELLIKSGDLRARFEREARITAKLQHPAIVNILEAGAWPSGEPFYVMKLVTGQSLDKAVAACNSLTERLGLLPNVISTVDALAYAHSKRVIHRDLKPANVLVGEFGETVVIDWGLAKDLTDVGAPELMIGPYRNAADAPGATVAGSIMGTPAYMPVEQAKGDAVDERADVYALGALLYHVIAGEAPYAGLATTAAILSAVIAGPPSPITERAPGVPPELATIITKAMSHHAADRYPTARELADDLKKFQTGQLVGSHRYSSWQLVKRWLKRHRAPVAVAAAALLVLGIAGFFFIRSILEERDNTKRALQDTERQRGIAEQSRAVAEDQTAAAQQTLSELMTESGRQELLAGRGTRAAVYLAEAYGKTKTPSVGLRALLADAMRIVEAQQHSLAGHTGEVVSAAFSADGTRVVTASGDHTAKIWDVATGKLMHSLAGHTGEVEAAGFSPDGSRVVTGSADQTARVWAAATGKLVHTLGGHTDNVGSVVFTPDGARIVTASASKERRGRDTTAKLWDATTGTLVATLQGHERMIKSIAVSPDGAQLATASNDVRIWNAKTGAFVRAIPVAPNGGTHSALFASDGRRIVTASTHPSALWDVKTGTRIVEFEKDVAGGMGTAAISPDGKRVVTSRTDRKIAQVWEADGGRLITTLEGHTDGIVSALFNSDGTRIVTAGDDNTARLWDAKTGALLATFDGHTSVVHSAVFSRDGKRIVTASRDRSAKVWNATTGQLAWSIEAESRDDAAAIGFTADGARVAIPGRDNTVKVWEVATGKELLSLAGHTAVVAGTAYSPDGSQIATAGIDKTAKIWDAATGKLVRTLAGHTSIVGTATFSPDGTRIVTASWDHTARIWDAATGALIAPLVGHTGLVRPVSFSPDGARLVTSSSDKEARLWDARTGKLLATLPHGDVLWSAVFSRDGARIVTASSDKTAKIWDGITGKLVASLEGHTGHVWDAELSPDGTRVVTASSDKSAKLWDARTTKLLLSLESDADVRRAAFSPDGARIITSHTDKVARIWDARTGKLLAELAGRAYDLKWATFSPDGSHVLAASSGSARMWDVRTETRDADAIRALLVNRVPWTLSAGTLVPAVTTIP